MPNRQEIVSYFQTLQDSICSFLEKQDGVAKFHEDKWEHHQGGGGRTRVIRDGNLFEKGGVNFSAVSGNLAPNIVEKLKVNESEFFATGVSIVIHPNSPRVPIIHMNVRYFELADGTYWFGGGIDLTPIYIIDELAIDFHSKMKSACDNHSVAYYSQFKKWADDYFFIPHRNETRGVGGIFFDRLSTTNEFSKLDRFNFVKEVGNSFIPAYKAQLEATKQLEFTADQKQWQLLRRGRYVEFNLVYDRGTKFGLDTNGRTESILMSLPKEVNWLYDFKTEKGSAEEYTLGKLVKGIDWAV